MSFFTQISYQDTGVIDAFSRLRVSQPENLFNMSQNYNSSTIKMQSINTGTGVTPSWNASINLQEVR